MPKVSVIIPVYGVEKYIERCARSLFEQTLDDVEYIFVNDCTPDRSMDILSQILNEYPNRKKQTRIDNMPKNCGQAEVRKKGTSLATGDYIIHCDSDDWVEKDAYRMCYDKAISESSDMVFFDFDITNGIYHNHLKRNPIIKDKNKLLSQLISGQLMGSLCGVLISKSLYSNPILFPEHNMNEDLVLHIQLAHYAHRYSYIPLPLYHYFNSSISITAPGTKEKAILNFNHSVANFNIISGFLEQNGFTTKYKREIECLKFRRMTTIALYAHEPEVKDLWKKAVYELGLKSFFNPFVPISNKLISIMTLAHIYKIVYDYRHK